MEIIKVPSSLDLILCKSNEQNILNLDICYHYIRQCIEDKNIELMFIKGSNNPADMFTKNLGNIKFSRFRETLGLEFYSLSG